MANLTAGVLASKIEDWHVARNLIDGSTDQAQYVKLIEEAGELAGNIARRRDIKDDIGDMVVVLINIAKRNNLKLEDCMEAAWNDIKHRKGKMVEGVFIKEADLKPTDALEWLEGDKVNATVIPIDATHTSSHIQYLKKTPEFKFWSYYKEGAWHVLSGEPIGELTELNKK